MKISMHPDHIQLSIEKGLGLNTDLNWFIDVFSGGMPSTVDFDNYFRDVQNQIHLRANVLDSAAGATGTDEGEGDPLRLMWLQMATRPIEVAPNLFDFKFSRMTANYTIVRHDYTAKWFLLYGKPNATIDSATDIHTPVFIGTIGAVGSGADMEMSDPYIRQNKIYKANDIRIKLTVNQVPSV